MPPKCPNGVTMQDCIMNTIAIEVGRHQFEVPLSSYIDNVQSYLWSLEDRSDLGEVLSDLLLPIVVGKLVASKFINSDQPVLSVVNQVVCDFDIDEVEIAELDIVDSLLYSLKYCCNKTVVLTDELLLEVFELTDYAEVI